MRFPEFRNHFKSFPLFSTTDIYKADPGFDKRRLVEWQHKDYLLKIANGYYALIEQPRDEKFLYLVSNKIYHPSYVSLESALAYYGFIPEGVFTITAVSTLKTKQFNSSPGTFSYRKLKEDLFFGYTLLPAGVTSFKMALPEKALLDYLYFNRSVSGLEDFENLRFNKNAILDSIHRKKIHSFCGQFNVPRLYQQVDSLLKYLRHA